jgi:transcriptional regulator with XRE-family HTH domain
MMKTLREARKEQNLTLAQLAALVGSNKPHMSLIERGKVLPSEATRRRLEINLGVKINWLAPPIAVTAVSPPATWNACEREFRYLIKMIASLPPDERYTFCTTARAQLLRVTRAQVQGDSLTLSEDREA